MEDVLPQETFWVVNHCVLLIVEEFDRVFKKLQGRTYSMREQKDAFVEMRRSLNDRYCTLEAEAASELRTVYRYVVSLNKIETVVAGCSYEIFETVDDDEKEQILLCMEEAIKLVFKDVATIQTDMDDSHDSLPPTTPMELVFGGDNAAEFQLLIKGHEHRLKKFFGPSIMNTLMRQRQHLVETIRTNKTIKAQIEANRTKSFEEAWAPLRPCKKFTELIDFCSGLASIMSGSHTVEGDFSDAKRIKSLLRSQLSNYALEGQMQCQQHKQLVEASCILKYS